MASEYSYRFTEKAIADLESIIGYMAMELSNPVAAKGFIDKLQGNIDIICAFPKSGARVTNEFLPDMDIRKIVVDSYLLYYTMDEGENTIFILRIIYGRRDVNEILNELNI
jgi:plasmid stabilization system protein ParE